MTIPEQIPSFVSKCRSHRGQGWGGAGGEGRGGEVHVKMWVKVHAMHCQGAGGSNAEGVTGASWSPWAGDLTLQTTLEVVRVHTTLHYTTLTSLHIVVHNPTLRIRYKNFTVQPYT